jgi:hypothetical protein
MSASSVEERLATLEANQRNLAADVTELKADVKVVLATLSQARGGWKALLLLASLAGAAGAFAGKLIAVLGGLKV